MEKAIVLFDGVCNLCSASVQFIIERDKHGYFKFASLQSETGQALLKKHNLPTNSFASVIMVENGTLYTHSTAALRIARHLDGAWKALYGLIVVPKFIRDRVYSFVADNRYRWFGKEESCWLPTPDLKARFYN